MRNLLGDVLYALGDADVNVSRINFHCDDAIAETAKDYFEKALEAVENDKAAKLMLERCEEFIKNPPENWDGAIAFMTK